MKDISTQFCLIEPELIKEELMMSAEISRPAASPRFLCNSKIIFDQALEESDSGLSWNQTFRGVSSDKDLINWNGRRAYIGIYRTDGSLIIMGSATEVPLITVTPHVGVFVVESSFDSVVPAVI